MSYTGPPVSVRALEQRIRNLEGEEGLAQRRRVSMALVVVGQMLPGGVIKGGSAMALRYGRGTRFTRDLDAARAQTLARFRSDFEEALRAGWAGFTGRLVERPAPRPPTIPTAHVMQPFDVKLDYRGRSWCTVAFELGHNEIGDADEPEFHLADDLARLFTDIGLEAPMPVPVMRADHRSRRSCTRSPLRAVNVRAIWSICRFSATGKASTSRSLRPRVFASSTTVSCKFGRHKSWRVSSRRLFTSKPQKASTSYRMPRRQSRGSTTSCDALWQRSEAMSHCMTGWNSGLRESSGAA